MSIVTTITQKATAMPINIEMINQYLREDFAKTTPEIQLLTMAATAWAEAYTGKSYTKQTRRVVFSNEHLELQLMLPYPNIINVLEVTEITEFGATRVLKTDEYNLVNDILYLTFIPVEGVSIQVDYECGYSDVRDIPYDVKLAITKKLASDYIAKEDIAVDSNVKVLTEAKQLLNEHKTIVLI